MTGVTAAQASHPHQCSMYVGRTGREGVDVSYRHTGIEGGSPARIGDAVTLGGPTSRLWPRTPSVSGSLSRWKVDHDSARLYTVRRL